MLKIEKKDKYDPPPLPPSSRYLHANYAIEQVEAETLNFEPNSYKEVVSCKDSARWFAAMQEEIDSLYKNLTWNLVEKPSGYKLVDYK